MRPLLTRAVPRSEHDADLEAAAANLTMGMHRVTGAFEDPSHESAFAAQLFRQAYLVHILLMGFTTVHLVSIALTPPAPRPPASVVALYGAASLVGRMLLHHQQDQERAQRIGTWSWTALMAVFIVSFGAPLLLNPAYACLIMHELTESLMPFFAFAHAFINGSHGMGFAHKTALVCLLPVRGLLVMVRCNNWLGLELTAIAMQILGYAIAHAVELRLRRSYADKLCTDQLLRVLEAEEKRRVEAVERRNEQLQAEKERLLYDMQRRGHPIDDDNRSAVRRGLQAGAVPSVSLTPSLPPGPPSSASSGYTAEVFNKVWRTATSAEASQQRWLESSGEALSVPSVPGASSGTETERESVADALLTEALADEETLLELQTMLNATEEGSIGRPAQEPIQGSQGSLPAQTKSSPVEAAGEDVAQQRVIPHTMQVISTPQGQGDKRQRQASFLPVHGLPVHGFGWHPSCRVNQPPESRESSAGTPTSLQAVRTDSMTPRQQALHVARHRIQATSVDVEVCQAVRTLAVALGASRTETATIKALRAVLLQLERPEMSREEARASTGASMSNFTKWQRRVRHAQLDLAPPAWW